MGYLSLVTDFMPKDNSFTGSLPTQIGEWPTHIPRPPPFCGENLPERFLHTVAGKMTRITGRLWANNGGYGGPIPTELGNLVNIVQAGVGFNANKFTGTLPTGG